MSGWSRGAFCFHSSGWVPCLPLPSNRWEGTVLSRDCRHSCELVISLLDFWDTDDNFCDLPVAESRVCDSLTCLPVCPPWVFLAPFSLVSLSCDVSRTARLRFLWVKDDVFWGWANTVLLSEGERALNLRSKGSFHNLLSVANAYTLGQTDLEIDWLF